MLRPLPSSSADYVVWNIAVMILPVSLSKKAIRS